MQHLSQLKVCFLAGTLSQGGAERQLYYMVRVLKQAGVQVRVLCLAEGEYWFDKIQALNVPVVCVGNSNSRIGRLRNILRELKSAPPDILQSQHFYTNAYAALAARRLGLQEIGAMRNDGASEVQDCGGLFGRLNLHLPRMLAANSRPAIAYAEACGIAKEKLFFLPNVVDRSQLTQTPRLRLPVQIVLVGRLEAQKRVDRFLRVLAQLKESSTTPIKGVIVGTGSLRDELLGLAGQLGLLPDAVEFRGPTGDIKAVYEQSDILALTSDHEGTPNVVLEAMAAGLPVVATRVGGIPDIIQHGITGFLSAPQEESCLIEPLLKLIGAPRLREQVGRAARAHVEAHHSPESLLQKLTTLYRVSSN
jgi:glycosyltransferase involved in cell wall biosynthesis